MTTEERREMMAKARAAKTTKTNTNIVEDNQTKSEYDYAPYDVVTEEHAKGMRFVLLLNGLHKVEFHGTEAECMKSAESFVESGDMSKAVNVNAQ